MAKGRLVALGPVQHLKTKYLDGYIIDLNCHSNTPEHVIDAVVADVLKTVVPGSKLDQELLEDNIMWAHVSRITVLCCVGLEFVYLH